jgi:hypothetical protein
MWLIVMLKIGLLRFTLTSTSNFMWLIVMNGTSNGESIAIPVSVGISPTEIASEVSQYGSS